MPSQPRPTRTAFTLIEMLLVVSLIVMLIALLLPAMSGARKRANLSICQNNLKQLGTGITSYTVDNASWYPYHASYNGNWMWDMTYEATDEIASRGGDKLDIFYCPSNTEQNVTTLWNFNPNFRVTGYFFTFKRANGPMAAWPEFLGGERWLRTSHSKAANPATMEVVTDALIANSGNFTHIQGGWPTPHRSAHLDSQTHQPEGGNALFMDNHIEWRDFADMELQYHGPEHWF